MLVRLYTSIVILLFRFLLPLINKERQIESLVDKLCGRLKESNNEVQEHYISYCLMLIKYTDKSLTKLSDNISYYTDKLKNPKVYNNFNIIISANSKMAKPAIKDILNELTSKIERIVKDEDFAIMHSQKTPGKRKYYLFLICLIFNPFFIYLLYLYEGLTTVKKKAPKITNHESSEDDFEPLQLLSKRSAKCRSRVKRRLLEDDGEEEEISHKSVVSNTRKTVKIKNNEDFETDDGKIQVTKPTTRQNRILRSSRKNPRNQS